MINLMIPLFQISDFYQRRMIQSSPSMEQDTSKENVKKADEQELEVPPPTLPLTTAALLGPRMTLD